MQTQLEIAEHFILILLWQKEIICFTIFTDTGTTVWHTHSHEGKPDKNLASKYLCIQESCTDNSYVVNRQIFPTGRRQMLYDWYYYTVYICHHLPSLNLYATKWEYQSKGGIFLPDCFLISSVFSHMPSFHNFHLAARDKLRSIVSFFFPIPHRSRNWGFGWRQTRFHLLGRSVHPMNAFETSPSVLCQSQSPSCHITQTVIHNLSFFICQILWWKICYPNLTHK